MHFPKQNIQLSRERLGPTLLACCHIAICCVSLAYATQRYDMYHLFYDPSRLPGAILFVAAFALVSLLFAFADFSFGYFVGFYFYTMVAGYLWLNCFSDFNYNRELAGLSAAASAVAFLLPALFITSHVGRTAIISPRAFDRLLALLFGLSLATFAISASYNFQFVSPHEASSLRNDAIPTPLAYLIGMTCGVFLPFLFACSAARKNYWQCGGILLLLLFYYPITASKAVFFAPAWLCFIMFLSRIFEAKTAVILSLLGPVFVGVILIALFQHGALSYDGAIAYFDIVNFRMVAIPSSAMDIYNDFFSKHDLTYFCQIKLLKSIISCPYHDQLSIVLRDAYPFGGTFNASLFATEGIASVGSLLAPASVFVCGLVIAVGNRFSAGLPPSFILVSGAILPHILLNVPLSIALFTHGMALLFLLWYITPRSMFGRDDNTNTKADVTTAPKCKMHWLK
jgi:hypothetical protein